LSVCR